MCVAFPGKIVEINDNAAKIDYSGNIVWANCGIVDAKVGDWALVHAGLIIQILSEEEGNVMRELFEELEEEVNSND